MGGRFDRDELLARTSLPALLDELCGPATSYGRTAKWRCPEPDHDDQHRSVTVTVDRRGIERWRCWSGGHGGTAIDAIHAALRLGNREAIEELARRTGLQPERTGFKRIVPPRPPPAVHEPVALHPNVVRYVETCEQLLWKPAGRAVLDYLTGERGLDPDVLRNNRVGADPGSNKLRRAGGLPKGGPGAVFPALTADGHVAYVQTRYLNVGDGQSKYGNPVCRLGANPRHGWTQPAGTPKEAILVCEGLPDAYTANSAGYTAIAVLGAMNATPALVERLLAGIGSRPVIVALDGDTAGTGASTVLTDSFRHHGTVVVDLSLPAGVDLNSWVHTARTTPQLGPNQRPTPHPQTVNAPTMTITGP